MTFANGNKHGRKYKLNGRRARKPTVAGLKKKAWSLLSKWVRLSAADEGGFCSCYTCGVPIDAIQEAQAGHAIPGRHGAVLLDVEIIRPQCRRCNLFMGGRYEVFAAKLIRENGIEWFERKLDDSRRIRKWDRGELEEFIETYKQQLRALDASQDNSSL